jgi:hypothetical protein
MTRRSGVVTVPIPGICLSPRTSNVDLNAFKVAPAFEEVTETTVLWIDAESSVY